MLGAYIDKSITYLFKTSNGNLNLDNTLGFLVNNEFIYDLITNMNIDVFYISNFKEDKWVNTKISKKQAFNLYLNISNYHQNKVKKI